MSINKFFIIVIATIVITRIWLWVFPSHGPTIVGFRPHHYIYGLVLVAIYFLVSKPIFLAIGSGLVIDEIPLFFIFHGLNWPDNHWKEYFSWQSIIWIVIICLISYLVAIRLLQKL